MSESQVGELETVLEQSDEELQESLPEVLPSVADDPEALLTTNPEAFRELAERMATLEGIEAFAENEPEAVDAFLTLLWDGLELISRNIDQVGEDINQEFSICWHCTDTDVEFHMETDPEEGLITGGPGELDAELDFEGESDVMFSMLGDPEFDGTQAFMQGQFQIDGPIPKAQQLAQVMESALDGLADEQL